MRCLDGNVVETGLCPDGHVFNEYADPKKLACQLPFGIDCSERPNLQPAQPNGDCPHQFGMVGQCQNFIICDEGNAKYFKCPEGLAFNETIGEMAVLKVFRRSLWHDSSTLFNGNLNCFTFPIFQIRIHLKGVCDWGDRGPACQLEQVLGFTCPEPPIDQLTLFGDHARYPHSDPDRFYVCMRWNSYGEPNLTPRVHTCESGLQFDAESFRCQPAPTGSGRSRYSGGRAV